MLVEEDDDGLRYEAVKDAGERLGKYHGRDFGKEREGKVIWADMVVSLEE